MMTKNGDESPSIVLKKWSRDDLVAELHAAMIAIEVAVDKGYTNLWMESDSQLVILAFKSSSVVPWHLKARWENCLYLTRSMSFFVTHIYREGNFCADRLANIGLSLSFYSLAWWIDIPDIIRREYIRNRLGMPNFSFISF
jgi:ribonuclease HI